MLIFISFVFTFAYDAFSRLTSENEKPVGGTGLLVRYTYVTGVPFLQINAPDNSSQTYNLDVFGRMRNMVYNSQGIASYTYTGILLTKRSSNGGTVSYTYDSINRPSTIFIGRGVTTPSYTYNDSSDILSDGTKSYTYDWLARVIKATPTISGATTESYTYDKTGNRVVNSVNTGSINYTTNSLDQYTLLTGSILSGSLIYDNNGNIQTDGSKTYSYDYNNRLIQINIWTGILAKYTYDTLGRRTQKIDYSKSATNPEATMYIYSGDNLLSEYKTIWVSTGSGVITPLTLIKRYINGIWTDTLVGYEAQEQVSPTSTGIVTTRYQYHTNELWSVVAITKWVRSLVQRYSYDAYGRAYVYSGTTLVPISSYTGNTYSNTRLFTWREYDRESGLYYMRARYYSPDTGRFISRDPIWQNDQVNLYTYVANSPLKYVDRMGRDKVLIIGFLWRSFDNGEVSKDQYSISWIWTIINGLSNSNDTSKLYYTDNFSPSDWRKEALKYIKENRHNYDKVVLLGHSMGADASVELSQQLYDEDVNVDLLVTFDLVSYDRTTEIKENVKVAQNYYQRNTNIFLRWSQLELSDGNTTTQLSNTEAKYYSDFWVSNPYSNWETSDPTFWHMDFWHTDIDQLLAPYAISQARSNF